MNEQAEAWLKRNPIDNNTPMSEVWSVIGELCRVCPSLRAQSGVMSIELPNAIVSIRNDNHTLVFQIGNK